MGTSSRCFRATTKPKASSPFPITTRPSPTKRKPRGDGQSASEFIDLPPGPGRKGFPWRQSQSGAGDYVILKHNEPLASAKTEPGICSKLIKMLEGYPEITVYYGVLVKEKDAERLVKHLKVALGHETDIMLLGRRASPLSLYRDGRKGLSMRYYAESLASGNGEGRARSRRVSPRRFSSCP
jgi:hypothetical protein